MICKYCNEEDSYQLPYRKKLMCGNCYVEYCLILEGEDNSGRIYSVPPLPEAVRRYFNKILLDEDES